MRGAEMGVMALLGLIVLLMVVRPLVRRIIAPDRAQAAAAAGMAAVAGMAGMMALPPGDAAMAAQAAAAGGEEAGQGGITTSGGPNVSIVGGDESVAISNRTSTMIDVAKVQGQVHAQSVQKVGELAEKNPHEAVSIIRGWLHEDAA
jgi:flagellar M-ring protein FliF